MVGLGDLRPGSSTVSSAWGTSADGGIIVGETGVEVGRQAFAWSNPGGMTPLEPFPGEGNWDRATALSLDRSVIVGVGNHGSFVGNTQAFRWTVADGYVGLGDLPGGSFQSAATDVSADGSVVVGSSRTDSMVGLRTEAFIWTEATGIKKLQDTLENDFGLNLSGWTLTEATSISADGRTIVGTGRNPAGDQEAWVATLHVPEPRTALLAVCAFTVWLASHHRRFRFLPFSSTLRYQICHSILLQKTQAAVPCELGGDSSRCFSWC
jgi:probable HAF family extracellular repeat protein